MEERNWTEDHISYLLTELAAEMADSGESSLGAEVRIIRLWFQSEPPFDKWSGDQQMSFVAEACAALSHRQLADLYEGLPDIERKVYWSAEEVLTWRAEHRVAPAQVDARMRREVPAWWAGERVHSIHCVLNERGIAVGKWRWDRRSPRTFDGYVNDAYTAWEIA